MLIFYKQGKFSTKRNQKSPKKENLFISLFNSQTTTATNYSIRSSDNYLTVQKQDKLALNPLL